MDLPTYLDFKRPNELDEFGYHLTKKKLMLHSSYTLIPPKEINKIAYKYLVNVFLLIALIIGLNTQDKLGSIRPILQIISVFFIIVHFYNAFMAFKLQKVIYNTKIGYFEDLSEDIIISVDFSEFIELRKARIKDYELAEGFAEALVRMKKESKILKKMLWKKKFKKKDL